MHAWSVSHVDIMLCIFAVFPINQKPGLPRQSRCAAPLEQTLPPNFAVIAPEDDCALPHRSRCARRGDVDGEREQAVHLGVLVLWWRGSDQVPGRPIEPGTYLDVVRPCLARLVRTSRVQLFPAHRDRPVARSPRGGRAQPAKDAPPGRGCFVLRLHFRCLCCKALSGDPIACFPTPPHFPR